MNEYSGRKRLLIVNDATSIGGASASLEHILCSIDAKEWGVTVYHRRRHVRELGQQPPDRRLELINPDPAWPRSYFGATSDANADRTVFRASPNRRAIAFTPMPSDMCNRRTSAQCSTLITSSLW